MVSGDAHTGVKDANKITAMANPKTTTLGLCTIIAAVMGAVISLIKSGNCDVPATIAAITAGIGLVRAHDATGQ